MLFYLALHLDQVKQILFLTGPMLRVKCDLWSSIPATEAFVTNGFQEEKAKLFQMKPN